MTIRLGYACINYTLRKKSIFCSRTCTLNTINKLQTKDVVPFLKDLAMKNIRDLLTILEWNEAHNIKFFRITSNLFPHITNDLIPSNDPYFSGNISFAARELRKVGQYAKEKGHRLTFHMTPYVQLASLNPNVLKKSILELHNYAQIIKYLGVDDSCIIMHIGGIYHTNHETQELAKLETLERWYDNFKKLPPKIHNLIVVENDESYYPVRLILPFCQHRKIPFCFDLFHNDISKDHTPVTPQLIKKIQSTWPQGRTIKFHISEQQKGARFGAHAKMVRNRLPAWLMKLPKADIMVEAKNKELAVLFLKNLMKIV